MSYNDNDSGGMDEEQAIKKMVKVVESFNKYLKAGEHLGEKSLVQLKKTILSHEKAYKTDKDHQMWKQQDREVSKRNAIEIFQERQKELRLSKLINRSLSQQVTAYDSVFQSISGSRGVIQSLKMMTNRFSDIKKSIERLTELDQSRDDNKGDADKLASIKKARDIEQKILNKLTYNNARLKRMGDHLEKLGNFMEKHAGKLIIGAAAISILTGIISKALNVAPLFQAMMKLMQFAFTMVLMPIGTFFGAVIKPMVIGLVKKLAPEFGKWMDTSMAIGNALGMFLVSLDLKFFENIGKAISNLAKVTGLTDFVTDPENAPMVGAGAAAIGIGGVVAATVVTKKVLGNLGGSAAEVAGKSGSKTAVNMLKSAGLQAKILARLTPVLGNLGKIMPKLGTKLADAMVPKIASMIIPMQNIATKVAAKTAVKVGLKAIPIIGWATLIGDAMGSVMKEYAPEQYEGVRQGAFGVGAALGDTEGEWTEKILDVLGFGSMSTWEQIQEGFTALEETFAGEGIKEIETSMEATGTMAENFEKVITKMATEDGVTIKHDMIAVVEHFERLRDYGLDAELAAEQTAATFENANINIKKRLEGLVSVSNPLNDPNSPESRAARKASNAQQAENDARNSYGYQVGIGDQGHTGFGSTMNSANFWDTGSTPVVTPLQKRLADEAERAKKAFDKANPHLKDGYDGIYGDGYGDGLGDGGHRYGASGEPTGKTQAEMNAENNPKGMPMLSTGGIDWNAFLDNNKASGGWINEPVKGIGMNTGQTYSIGERGAEFVSPNGGGSGGGVTINIAKIERTADFNQLKPMIQRWILEANSRRGMI